MSAISIDVVLAYYNGSNYIREQIQSIKQNQLPHDVSVNIHVYDDGSRADEFAMLQSLASEDESIKVHRNAKNLGVIRTFERGIAQSRADYIMLSDQDDIWLNDKIAKSLDGIRRIEGAEPALVFTNLRPVDQNLNTLREHMLDLNFVQDSSRLPLLFQNVASGCTFILNRKLAALSLPFPEKIPMHDHWLACCAAFGGRLGYVAEPTILYRQHSGNTVGTPKRSLAARVRSPLKTFRQLDASLAIKSLQTKHLFNRLSEHGNSSAVPLLQKISEAFSKRNIWNLALLIKTGVFKAQPATLIFLSVAYLLSGLVRPKQATH